MLLLLLRNLARLPLGLLHFAGALGGWAVHAVSPGVRRKTRDNLLTAGLYSTRLALASAAAAGRAALETCYIWFRPAGDLLARVRSQAA